MNRLTKLNPFRRKDYTPGSNEESATKNSTNSQERLSPPYYQFNDHWAPGALNRLKRKDRWSNIKSNVRSWWHN